VAAWQPEAKHQEAEPTERQFAPKLTEPKER